MNHTEKGEVNEEEQEQEQEQEDDEEEREGDGGKRMAERENGGKGR